MFDERAVVDLDILDHLELYGSTVKVASLLGLSQSSCSRRYRSLSDQLDLDFDRGDSGYGAQRNLDVLSIMREAAQKLRVRRNQLRLSPAWHCSALQLPDQWRHLTVASMSTAHMLSLLDGRLIDLWLGGLLECQPLIQSPLELLTPKRLVLSQSLMAFPLFRWRLVLLAHRTHPLAKRSHLTPDDLQSYPSSALPLGVAPLLNRELQRHGLATCPYGGGDYSQERWELVAGDGHTLVFAPPHRLHALERQYDLIPLSYDLNITDITAVLGHRDVLADPCFAEAFKRLLETVRQSEMGRGPGIDWLL